MTSPFLESPMHPVFITEHARRLDLKPAIPANDPQSTFADFGRPSTTGA